MLDDKDLRKEDNETLKRFNILKDWQRAWEQEFHKINDLDVDENQKGWSLSKRSYFRGYLEGLARNKDQDQKTRQEDIHKLILLKAKCESEGFNEGETLGFKRGVGWSIGVLETIKIKKEVKNDGV